MDINSQLLVRRITRWLLKADFILSLCELVVGGKEGLAAGGERRSLTAVCM